MTTSSHQVALPYPNRGGHPYFTGKCSCGRWSVTYSWGGHRDAAGDAGEHIREAAKAEPVEAETLDGTITVLEGRSL